MNRARQWYAGVDWARDSHLVRLIDEQGRDIGEKIFEHSGQALAAMADWLIAQSGADDPGQLHIAIEVPHGPVVEALMERQFNIWAINPKQMDRFLPRSGAVCSATGGDEQDVSTRQLPVRGMDAKHTTVILSQAASGECCRWRRKRRLYRPVRPLERRRPSP
ncbi:MAG: transposase [Reyranellaceae bacterium]